MNRELPIRDNGVAPNATDASATLANLVYERLKIDILAGELKPGTRLRVEFVRDRYGMGSSPVREALTRLAAEGFIKRVEKRGFFVASVTADEFRELTHTRCWVEDLALRRSIENGDAAWEEAIVLAYHRLSRSSPPPVGTIFHPAIEWVRRHDMFHDALIAACGSRWLIEFCAHLRAQAYRYRRTATEELGSASLGEHEAIMKAAIDRDADKAVALLSAHYWAIAEVTLRRYETGELPRKDD